MNNALALKELYDLCPYSKFPAIDSSALIRILSRSRVIDSAGTVPDLHLEWTASTPQAVGNTIVPSTRNGYYYTATAIIGSGDTDTTEPAIWPTTIGATVVDNKVTWTATGYTYWLGAFDLNYAAALAWEWKANVCAHMTQQTVDGQSFNPQQLRPQFLEQARYYKRKRGIRSVPLQSGTAATRPVDHGYYR